MDDVKLAKAKELKNKISEVERRLKCAVEMKKEIPNGQIAYYDRRGYRNDLLGDIESLKFVQIYAETRLTDELNRLKKEYAEL